MDLQRHKGWLATAAVLVVSCAYLGEGIRVGKGGADVPGFHIDEAHKLSETFYYHLFFENRDWDHPAWREDFYARTNPPVAKYVFGAVLAARGHRITDQRLQDAFERHWKEPQILREHVPDDMLRITRYVSTFYGALLCSVVFFIGYRLGGVAVGIIAAVLVLGNPYFRGSAQRGLTDTILLFHLTLIVPVSFGAAAVLGRYWRRETLGGPLRRWGLLLLATVLVPVVVVAMAAGSKMNGALAGPIYAASVIAAAVWGPAETGRWRRIGLAGIVVVLVAVAAFGFFVAINPFYHQDPLQRAAESGLAFQDWMVKQQLEPGGGLFSLPERVAAVGYDTLRSPILAVPQFVVKIAASLGLVSSPSLEQSLRTLGVGIAILGFVGGLRWLVVRAFLLRETRDPKPGRRRMRRGTPGDLMVLVSWAVVVVASLVIALPLLRHRYVLPAYLLVCVIVAIGLRNLPQWCRESVADLEAAAKRGGTLRVRIRRLAAGLSVPLLWVVLTCTPWVIQPALLDPIMRAPLQVQGNTLAEYRSAVATSPGFPLLRQYLAAILLGRRQPQATAEALRHLEAARERLDDPSREQEVARLVLRSCVLYKLAGARSRMGDRDGAIQALRRHIADIERLRDGMVSNDAKVRAAFDRLIASRQQVLRRMLPRSPSALNRAGSVLPALPNP